MTATELYRRLEEAGCEALPARPKELGGAIRALSGRSSMLRVSFGWRGKEKVTRLELVPQLLKNSVGRVGSVGKDGISTNATDATNARSVSEEPPAAPLANATNATDAKNDNTATGERSRFTI